MQITAEHHYGWPLEPDLYMLPLAGHARTVRRRTLLPFIARSGPLPTRSRPGSPTLSATPVSSTSSRLQDRSLKAHHSVPTVGGSSSTQEHRRSVHYDTPIRQVFFDTIYVCGVTVYPFPKSGLEDFTGIRTRINRLPARRTDHCAK